MSASSYEMIFGMKTGKLSRNKQILRRAMKKGKAKERSTKEFMRDKAKKAKRSANTVYYREKEISDILPETAKLYERIEEDSDMNEFVKMMDDQYDQMITFWFEDEYDRMILDYLRDEEIYKIGIRS